MTVRDIISAAAGIGGGPVLGPLDEARYDMSPHNKCYTTRQESNPYSVQFKPDGTKMYVSGTTESVFEYNLSPAWEVGTAKLNNSFNASSNITTLYGMSFKPDGTKMYLTDARDDVIYEYNLSTAWDVSTASYSSNSFSVTSQDGAPGDTFFKSDGLTFFLIGNISDKVYEYTLSTAWDISTASYSNNSFSVSTYETSPYGITFKPDGTEMYIIGNSGDEINQFTLSTAWDITTASFTTNQVVHNTITTNVFATSTATTISESSPAGLAFKPDGTACFFVGRGTDSVWRLELSTAWDISSNSFSDPSSHVLKVTSQETIPYSVTFKPDGTQMYLIGVSSDAVLEYNLSTAWDVGSGSYSGNSFSVATEATAPNSLTLNDDGDKLYVLSSDVIYEYNLSTAWDITTASYSNNSFDVSSQDTGTFSFKFSYDGTKMHTVGTSNDKVYEYSLSTAWDISTASYSNNSFDFSSQEINPRGLAFNLDGTKMYVSGYGIYEYDLSTAWDITTASYSSNSFLDTVFRNLTDISFFSNKLFIVSNYYDIVYSIDLTETD